MMNRFYTATHSRSANLGRFAFTALMALSFLFAQSLMTTAFADKRPKNFGRVKIYVPIHDPVKNPNGYPILVDGQDFGNTTPNQITLELASGRAHTIEIIFPDNKRWTRDIFINPGRIYCVGVEYAPFTPPVEVPCPPCSITLEANSSVKQGDPVTVNANIDYKGSMDDLTYTWTVSPGTATIMSGGGPRDRTVTFDTAGIGDRELRVNLVVDNGFPPEQKCGCRIATATTGIEIPEPEPDKFQFVAFDDLKARLDNFVIDLQANQGATAYVIYYSGDRCPAGQASRLGERSRDYLVNSRGFDPNRLVIIDGGKSAIDWVELYVVKLGGQPPTPRPGDPPAVRADLSQYPCITDPTTQQQQQRRRPSRRRR
jgi:hypothetical protein